MYISEKAMAPLSSTLAWKTPWTEESGRLESMGSLRVGYDWATWLSLFTFMHWRRKWQPTPVFLPGESQGRGTLVGCCCPWGRTESDMTEWLHFHFSLSCTGEGNGNPLQCPPGMGKPGGLPDMGLHRVGHNWSESSSQSLFSNNYHNFYYIVFLLLFFPFHSSLYNNYIFTRWVSNF